MKNEELLVTIEEAAKTIAKAVGTATEAITRFTIIIEELLGKVNIIEEDEEEEFEEGEGEDDYPKSKALRKSG